MDRGLQELLGAFHPRILLIAAKLHERIYQINPDICLAANVPFKLLHYRLPEDTKPFCSVELHKGVVKLHFLRGDLLDDPEQLLKGTGRTRRIILNTTAQATGEAVQSLLRQSVGLEYTPPGAFQHAGQTGTRLTVKKDKE